MVATVGGVPIPIEELPASPGAHIVQVDTSGGAVSVNLARANYYISELNVPHWYTTDGTAPGANPTTMKLPAGRHPWSAPMGVGATWTLRLAPDGAGSANNRIAAVMAY